MRTHHLDCAYVASYLDSFGKGRGSVDVEGIGEHVQCCPSCHESLSRFFRVMEVPQSEYLEQSLNDLTESIYNLAKALLKRPVDDDDHQNVRFVAEPGQPEQYKDVGNDVIDDVQDYTGSDDLDGLSMEGLRGLIETSTSTFELPHELLDHAIRFEGPQSLDCHNLKGILYLQEEKPERAREQFLKVIHHRPVDAYVRTVQVHSVANLAYVHIGSGAHDEAVEAAMKARVLAEECGISTFNADFTEIYARLLRGSPEDVAEVGRKLEKLRTRPESAKMLAEALLMSNNQEIKALYEQHDLI